MKNSFPLLLVVFLLLFTGCTKKGDDPRKKEDSRPAVESPEPLPEFPPESLSDSLSTETPPFRSGVLLDDLPDLEVSVDIDDDETAYPLIEYPVERPEPVESLTPQTFLEIDMVDPLHYLEDGGKFQDTIYVGATPVGFQSTELSRQTVQDFPVLCIVVRNQIQVLHQGTPLELSAAHRSLETLQGEFVGCESILQRNDLLVNQVAKVIENKLEITSTREGQTVQDELPWKIGARVGGVCAIQVSLLQNPMQDNEERRISFYDPTRRAIIETTLVAQDVERTGLLDGRTLNLRRIETIFKAPQEQIPITFWTDATGHIIGMSMPFLETETLTTIRVQMKNEK